MLGSGRHRRVETARLESVLDAPGADELRDEFLATETPSWQDRSSALLLASMLGLAALWGLWHSPVPTGSSIGLALFLVLLYVVGFRTEFRAASGAFVATEPVLVGILLTLPLEWAPLVVVVAVMVGSIRDEPPQYGLHTYLTRAGNAFHCLGPVAVLAVLAPPHQLEAPTWVLLLALLAQFTLDGAAALVRGAVQGVTPRQMARPLLWTFSVDALLAPIGYCIVMTAQQRPGAYLLLAAPIVLVRLMQSDRESHRKQAEEIKSAYSEVREQVQLDPLTGLHNRRGWDAAVARAAVDISGPDRRCAIVLIADVDHLKPTNDTYGHETGDRLLQEIGHLLTDLAPSDAMVARLGGDEFGVLFTVPSGYLLPDFMAMARASMDRATRRLGHLVSASVGVAVCPPGGSVEETVRRADHACALDKARRRIDRLSMPL